MFKAAQTERGQKLLTDETRPRALHCTALHCTSQEEQKRREKKKEAESQRGFLSVETCPAKGSGDIQRYIKV